VPKYLADINEIVAIWLIIEHLIGQYELICMNDKSMVA
jgi:hypothetical protein